MSSVIKKSGTYLILIFSMFFMCLLFLKCLVFLTQNKIFWAILIAIDFFLFPILWYKYYKEEIIPYVEEKSSLKVDSFLLVWGALFGVIFSDYFLQPLLKLSNSGNFFQSLLAILLGMLLIIVASFMVLFVRLVHGISVKYS
jgi:hypothetical protein